MYGIFDVSVIHPRRFAPDRVTALRKKSEVTARDESKRLVYEIKVLGQPVPSEVRSMIKKLSNPVFVNDQRIPRDE